MSSGSKANYTRPAARSGASSRGTAPSHYTLAHAGRQVRLGPVTFWVAVGSLVIMGGWTLATGSYFAFKDDVLTRLIARHAEQQVAYEDRIAELRAQIDRIASRQLLDQEQFESKLDQIMRRQDVLETRASSLSSIPDAVTTGSVRRPPMPRPSPLSERDSAQRSFRPEREARNAPATRPAFTTHFAMAAHAAPRRGGDLQSTVTRLNASLDRVEANQERILDAIEEDVTSRTQRMRSVLSNLGIKPGKLPAKPSMGGPFIPAKLSKDADPFERQVFRVHIARTDAQQLIQTLQSVPVRKPIPGGSTTSGFGVRNDPFGRGPAMHAGIDFRAPTGHPVRSAAAGRVTIARRHGGYGQMVEVDHGRGMTTRYAHLSAILVKQGQRIRPGQIIGRVGSTGRSTGPHLHYETRINDRAVDPQRFLSAGIKLGGSVQ